MRRFAIALVVGFLVAEAALATDCGLTGMQGRVFELVRVSVRRTSSIFDPRDADEAAHWSGRATLVAEDRGRVRIEFGDGTWVEATR